MTTIRQLCCNDLLGITHLVMALGEDMGSLYMSMMTIHPEYSLVAVSHTNQITGFIAAFSLGENIEKHCDINEMNYLTEEMGAMLVKAIEDRADKIHEAYYVDVNVPVDNQKRLNLFKRMGYTCDGKFFDKRLVRTTILKKDLAAAHDRSDAIEALLLLQGDLWQ